MIDADIARCAAMIAAADGILVTAGAGMGIDSGLPDFRGKAGFWRAYPGLSAAGLHFEDIANPAAFRTSPRRAWGFYGHRLVRYRETEPHEGFTILQRISAGKPHGCFVVTSNVDGHFQKAGFQTERIYECHGTIHSLQCLDACTQDVWAAAGFGPEVDALTCELRSPLPHCPRCGEVARPNILMFADDSWIGRPAQRQAERLYTWLDGLEHPLIIEIGAGTGIPTLRRLADRFRFPIIRINPTDWHPPERPHAVGLPLGALEALRALDQALTRSPETGVHA
jgi:NAD-dependent SIR2 family protein deacetylase